MSGAEVQDLLDTMAHLRGQCSMDYWWPILEEVDVFTPETVRVECVEGAPVTNGKRDGPRMNAIMYAIEEVGGPPAFIRTDQASAKHHMAIASKVPREADRETVKSRVQELLGQNIMSDLPYESVYVREWLKLYHEYKTFVQGGTPIAAEIRYFILDGEIHDYGFYWPAEAVWERTAPDDWREGHERVRETALNGARVGSAEKYARRVADAFDKDYWSVDFALTESDQWYCIDMARGELSWHPESVERAVPDPRDQFSGGDGE